MIIIGHKKRKVIDPLEGLDLKLLLKLWNTLGLKRLLFLLLKLEAILWKRHCRRDRQRFTDVKLFIFGVYIGQIIAVREVLLFVHRFLFWGADSELNCVPMADYIHLINLNSLAFPINQLQDILCIYDLQIINPRHNNLLLELLSYNHSQLRHSLEVVRKFKELGSGYLLVCRVLKVKLYFNSDHIKCNNRA